MAIRFTDKPTDAPRRKPDPVTAGDEPGLSVGEARFATPIEASGPVNPDASGELPFEALPRAEKVERRKRGPKGSGGR
ncbi:hypothetical protein P7D22_14655 [Lichenihabitans sp. Uapishka_5]|uniref:hypothetical protein n=1 Tax=Lichenihabitans sp. Uapishka_5 TaxID=3037302 RepID=UPI0029E7E3C2|nr:hypothetical protein [Lichenihabitans sp. Uapishka_5]MDX7952409.1 hypothetical protein [Lichenihabitans sp. Uapishka_5]